ncbi:HAD-IIA family hydrolase [Kocuria palustris]|uniref:HAD-IIA family hydrolase n=1 Tax=Kocuria palustris TaxID=71999 RepID=UPI0019D05EB0|nr:HAD-IIA family hydrolase [Kocuria palustris]MBN6753389.1 HAD-IIA family hydrolase [Kocuria palustris]MBN6758096.1 HAD-IIA family hydrolase [Kocuria palustris]MBN6763124.1 HAD-IIA family hydrolase [Kocuria palustris]MBN6782894.1 HAD-IIA family hydrolase [Kocuria palustris]MBN6799031.1 HAD-IIA family hydrolase [Kocuria palustris]
MTRRLIDGCDAILADLDGVVYAGPGAISEAPESLERAKSEGVPVMFVTNNASRAVKTVAEHLSELGVATRGEDVVSSAQAAAQLLSDRLPAGSRVLITGAQALSDYIAEAGLTPVSSQHDDPVAVVQGFDPEIGWSDLAEAAYTLADASVLWIATNTDGSIPRERGIAPGNGTLVDAVARATGRTPEVAGKPEAPIFRTGAQRLGAQRPLVIGDRLDTDILGGNRAGFATALVLTGVDTVRTALGAIIDERPDHLIADLTGLFAPEAEIAVEESDGASIARCGAAQATAHDDGLRISGDEDDLDAWRAACAAWWARHPQVETASIPEIEWTAA